MNVKGIMCVQCVHGYSLTMSKALAKAGPTEEAKKQIEGETVIDPALQKRLEEQQKSQEAVLHKDRVGLFSQDISHMKCL